MLKLRDNKWRLRLFQEYIMKKKYSRITALVLCISMLMGFSAYAAFPVTLLKKASTALAGSVTLTSSTFRKDSATDKLSENYITYTPNKTIKPVVVYGSKICNYGNFIDMAQLLEKRGYSVVAGINGDYYNMDTCQPLGIIIENGKLKASDDQHYAVGFKADGTAVMGSPALNMSFTVGGSTYPFAGINKERTNEGFYLFTEDFSYTTKSKNNGTEVVCSLTSGSLTVNSKLTLTVDKVIKSSGAYDLPAGKILISLADTASNQDVLKKFTPGASVTVNVSCPDKIWDSVQFAAGSLYKLVTAGKIESGLKPNTAGPRTAVGIKANGDIVFYTADGRQPDFSMGITMTELAERMLALGCVEATIMDGGGSTTMGAKQIGDSTYTVINSPSGGEMRNVSQFIMLAATGSGSASIMGVYPYNAMMLTGTKKTFTAGTADAFGNAKATGRVEWSLKSGAGSLDGNGVFTAAGAGDVVISASSGDLNASTTIKVVDAPDSISVYDESTNRAISSINLEAGQSMALTASAIYKQMPLDITDTDFKWKLSSNIGTVDENGNVKAGLKPGSGTLTVIAGSAVTYIPVTVELNISRLEDFEGSELKLSSSVQNAAAVLNSNMEKVRFGKQSLNIKYNLSGGNALVPIGLTAPSNTSYVSLWAYGDGSSNSLSLVTSGGKTEAASLNFTGWKQLVFAASSNITGIQISGKGSGDIWLDQITAAPSQVTDTAAPVIANAAIKNGKLVADVSDAFDGSLFYFDVSVYCDGKPLQYDYQNSLLSSNLPTLDAKTAHRITVCATDMSGNRARYSIDIPASGDYKTVFADMKGHWSEKYVSYLNGRGVVSGVTENKVTNYLPDDEMTREQFAVIMTRYLGIETEKYKDIKLSFGDLKDISDYALPSVRAMYALGIIKGVSEGDKINFEPKDSLTRAQAMTIIGRTVAGGYEVSELAFPDASSVPDWALDYVKLLSALKIVGGDENGNLNPLSTVTRAEVAKIITVLY